MNPLFSLTALFLCINILFTPSLWIGWGGRTFPTISLDGVPEWLQVPALAVGLAAVALRVFFPHIRFLWVAFLLSMLTLVAVDQNCLQPWFYEYVVLLILLWDIKKEDYVESQAPTMTIVRVVLATIYVWSGIQKWNAMFLTKGIAWLIAPIVEYSASLGVLSYLFFCLAPVLEPLIGVLLFTRFQRYAAVSAILMHLMVLVLLGPFGKSWNSAVWPWNIAMISLNIILFCNPQTRESLTSGIRKLSILKKGILALFISLPILSFFDKWDMYLSFALYSSNTKDAYFELDSKEVAERLPSYMQRYITHVAEVPRISIIRWSLGDLNVPAIPERRLFLKVGSQLCRMSHGQGRLILRGRPSTLTGAVDETLYRCAQLE